MYLIRLGDLNQDGDGTGSHVTHITEALLLSRRLSVLKKSPSCGCSLYGLWINDSDPYATIRLVNVLNDKTLTECFFFSNCSPAPDFNLINRLR